MKQEVIALASRGRMLIAAVNRRSAQRNTLLFLLAAASISAGQDRRLEPPPFGYPEGVPKTLNLPPYRMPVPGTALEKAVDPEEYQVGPGDMFLVTVTRGDPLLQIVTVTPTGSLALPEVGLLDVEGLTAAEVSRLVRQRTRDTFPGYEVECILYGIREILVSVAGAVKRPGLHKTTPQSRLTEVLGRAGGSLPRAALHRIELHHPGGTVEILDLTRYYHAGDTSQNPFLKGGDQVTIPFGDLNTEIVSVRGMGGKPGYQAISPGETLASFIARTPQTQAAELITVDLLRTRLDGSEILQQIDAAQFDAHQLKGGDVLFIGEIAAVAVIGEVNRPGRYPYQPGLSARDYVAYAGGTTRDGSLNGIRIARSDGENVNAGDGPVRAGDTIYIGRSFSSIVLGQMGVIQASLTVLNIVYLAYLVSK